MGFSCRSGWECVEPQSFSFSTKRAHCCTITQDEMRYESTQVKAPPLSRRRMRPPTPLQNSNSSFEEEQEQERSLQERNSTWKEEEEVSRWKLKNWEICWVQMTLMWISDESWKKQETEKGARYLRPSAQMVRVNSW